MDARRSKLGEGYEPVEQGSGESRPSSASGPMDLKASHVRKGSPTRGLKMLLVALVLVAGVVCLGVGLGLIRRCETMTASWFLGHASEEPCPCRPDPDVPQYFRTSPNPWAGPMATGPAPFLMQTVTFDPTGTYEPNAPLQTNIPIEGMGSQNESVFKMMGNLSPYAPAPGFGVNEYPLPAGAEIVQVQMLARHGSRYPTFGSNVQAFGDRIAAAAGKFTAKGSLQFLNDWKFELGGEILVPRGRQELFENGVLHAYNYGRLYDPNSTIIVRTTDRMLKSAENFLAGMFGLEWTRNATIEVIIEEANFNNSLAGYLNCPNSGKASREGHKASKEWVKNYLQNATARFREAVDGYDWTIEDTYAAQTMCPYETVAYGFSRFCDLFTYEEWQGFEYAIDLDFYWYSGFGSPTGRAVGIGYQQEVMARLQNHTLGYSGSQINVTLDNNTVTFPLNQSLYLDFSHDSNIMSVLTAFGLRQFAGALPPTGPPPGGRNLTVSHMTPFGGRLDMEMIRTPHPVAADRSGPLEGGETRYVHLLLNQRTVPLGWSFPDECDAARVDGWCELGAFLRVQEGMPARAQYDRACFGEYEAGGFGSVVDGAPP